MELSLKPTVWRHCERFVVSYTFCSFVPGFDLLSCYHSCMTKEKQSLPDVLGFFWLSLKKGLM